MNFIKVTVSLVIAGALLTGYGLLTDTPSETVEAPSPVESVTIDPVHGLASLDEVVDLFEQRSNDRASDYLSRTQLGQALNAQAREQADLEGYERAELVLKEALAINPRWIPAKLALARSLHSQHRFAEALQHANAVIERDPTSLSALATAGDAHLEVGNLAVASDLYAQLVSVERSAPVVSRLARLAMARGIHSGAVDLAVEALDLSEQLALRPAARAFYHFQLGRMQFEVGAVDDAIASYNEARVLDPGNPAATESLAFASASQGEHDRAVDLYQELIAHGPAPDLHASLADSLTALGRETEAAEQWALGAALAAETADRFPAERRHLVGFYQAFDPARAVQLAQQDLMDRQDWAAYDTLAWALHHAGDDEAAAAVYSQAPLGDPPSAAMLYHQAEVLAAVAESDRARRLATEALELNSRFHPTEADAARALVARLSS